jgi:hypothetical protein
MKIFFYRHQAGGVLWQFPFKSQPTEQDCAVLRAMMVMRHGFKHPKTTEPYWDRIVSIELLEPGSMKADVEEKTTKATTTEFQVSGSANVK